MGTLGFQIVTWDMESQSGMCIKSYTKRRKLFTNLPARCSYRYMSSLDFHLLTRTLAYELVADRRRPSQARTPSLN